MRSTLTPSIRQNAPYDLEEFAYRILTREWPVRRKIFTSLIILHHRRTFTKSDNAGKFFIAIPETPKPLDPQNDFHLLMHGKTITVSPMALQAADITMAAAMDGKL